MTADALLQFVKEFEGWSAKPYKCPAGKWTIGYGYNMEAHGIPANLVKPIFDVRGICREDAEKLLIEQVAQCVTDARRIVPGFDILDRPRQYVIIDMIYNLGANGFAKFVRTITAIVAGQFDDAAKHMQASKWYRQVGHRAKRNVRIMRTGAL